VDEEVGAGGIWQTEVGASRAPASGAGDTCEETGGRELELELTCEASQPLPATAAGGGDSG